MPIPLLSLYRRFEQLGNVATQGSRGGTGLWTTYLPESFLEERQGRPAPAVRRAAAVAAAASTEARRAEAKATAMPTAGGSLEGRVWESSRDPAGCRAVQAALESAGTDEEREALAAELEGHVFEASRCPHANHVLQKCVLTIRRESFQFIVDEVAAKLFAIAKSRFGCRVIQRLIERCESDQVGEIVSRLTAEFKDLSRHEYSNYVLQHILEHGTPEQQRTLRSSIEEAAYDLCAHPQSCALLCATLSGGSAEDQLVLARRIVATEDVEPGHLAAMACKRRGHVVLKRALAVLGEPESRPLVELLEGSKRALAMSKYGLSMLKFIEELRSGVVDVQA